MTDHTREPEFIKSSLAHRPGTESQDLLGQFPIPVFRENDDLVIPELISVTVVCHGAFLLSVFMRFAFPRNEKSLADRNAPTGLACGGCLLTYVLELGHLTSFPFCMIYAPISKIGL
jgi:hypothetical protein